MNKAVDLVLSPEEAKLLSRYMFLSKIYAIPSDAFPPEIQPVPSAYASEYHIFFVLNEGDRPEEKLPIIQQAIQFYSGNSNFVTDLDSFYGRIYLAGARGTKMFSKKEYDFIARHEDD